MLFRFFIRDHGHTELRARYFSGIGFCQNTNVHLSNEHVSSLPLDFDCLIGVILVVPPPIRPHRAWRAWSCQLLQRHGDSAASVRPKFPMRVPNWLHEAPARCRMRTLVKDGTRPELPCPPERMPPSAAACSPAANQPTIRAPFEPPDICAYSCRPFSYFSFSLRLFLLSPLLVSTSPLRHAAQRSSPSLPYGIETMASRILSHGARALTRTAPVRSFTTSPARLDTVVAAPLPARRPVGALRGGYVFPLAVFLSSPDLPLLPLPSYLSPFGSKEERENIGLTYLVWLK